MPKYAYVCEDCKNKFYVNATMEEKIKGLKVNCPDCKSSKVIQTFENIYFITKGRSSNSSGYCNPDSGPNCC